MKTAAAEEPEDKGKKKKIILTSEQKKLVDDNFDRLPKLKELAQFVFNDPNINGNFGQAHAIRDYIASDEFQNKKPGAKLKTTEYVKGDNLITLNDNQKLLIRNNLGTMSWLELARLAFNKPTLTRLHTESKAVYTYCMEIDPGQIPDDERLTDTDEYKPPMSTDRLVSRVNKYRFKFNGDKSKVLDKNDLRPNDIKNLQALMGYMHTERFTQQASKYTRESDRALYESSFIRYCFDKPDLLEEEVDNYVALCSEIVTITQIERIIQLMDSQLEEALKGEGTDKKALTMTFNESINNQRDKLNQAKKTYQTLLDKLVGARSERIDAKIQQTASLHSLVEMWKKEEDRKKIIAMAQKRNKEIRGEVERLKNIDDLRAEIFGLNEDDIAK